MISMREAEEIQEMFEEVQEAWFKLKDALKHALSSHEYERYRQYGIGHVEAGLGEGDALPVMYPVSEAVELVKTTAEEDEKDEEDCCPDCGMEGEDRGHMECSSPQDIPDEEGLVDPMATEK